MIQIFYIHDQNTHEIYFFLNTEYTAARNKEIELAEKYGYEKLYGRDVPPFPIETHKFSSFYGTVWLATIEERGDFRFSIHSHWSEVKIKKDMGYTVKKIILKEYEGTTRNRPIRKREKYNEEFLEPIDLEKEDIEKEILESAKCKK